MLTKIKLAIAGALRKSSDKATEAIIEGAAREQAVDYEKIDTDKRDHFS